MSDISVIGLDTMGSAVARALLRDRHRVTAQDSVTLAPAPVSAGVASSSVLVYADDYKVKRAVPPASESARAIR